MNRSWFRDEAKQAMSPLYRVVEEDPRGQDAKPGRCAKRNPGAGCFRGHSAPLSRGACDEQGTPEWGG